MRSTECLRLILSFLIADDIELESTHNVTEYRTAFTEVESNSGIYSYSATGAVALPPGRYNLFLGTDTTGKVVTIDDSSEYIALAYYTVQATYDTHLVSAEWSLLDGYQHLQGSTLTLLDRAKVQFTAPESADSGDVSSRLLITGALLAGIGFLMILAYPQSLRRKQEP